MPTSIPALVTPAVLKWARIEGGYHCGQVAKRACLSAPKLLAWEKEEDQAKPTLRQVYARGVVLTPELICAMADKKPE